MRCLMFVLLMCSVLLVSPMVTAQELEQTSEESRHSLERRLAGSYMLTASINCLSTAAGFGPDGALLGKSGTALNSVSGVLTLDRNGTGSIEAENAGITAGDRTTGQVVVSNSTLECDVTWGVSADRVLTLTSACEGDVLSGEATGLSFVSAPFDLSGILPRRLSSAILIANTTPEIEIFQIPAIGFSAEQKCGRTATLVRIDDDSDSDSDSD